MIASDIMRTDVVTIKESQTLRELVQILLDHRITGAPVVDASGRLVGVVSQTDLVRRERERTGAHEAPDYHHLDSDRWLDSHGFQVEAPDYVCVRDVMTPAVLSADASTSVAALARCMVEKHVHRLVITRKGKLAGIVTSMDILRAFMKLDKALAGGTA